MSQENGWRNPQEVVARDFDCGGPFWFWERNGCLLASALAEEEGLLVSSWPF